MTETPVDIWFHARETEIEHFAPDRPAFFGGTLEDVEMWAGRSGYVVEVQLDVRNPIDDIALRDLALEMGLEDVFNEGFSDFPDVSSYLYDERIRRKLEELGCDGYRGEDGYLWVTVVWDPELIRVISHGPYRGKLSG